MGSKLSPPGNFPQILIGSLLFPASHCNPRASGTERRADLYTATLKAARDPYQPFTRSARLAWMCLRYRQDDGL
jgi:hypothetical protein